MRFHQTFVRVLLVATAFVVPATARAQPTALESINPASESPVATMAVAPARHVASRTPATGTAGCVSPDDAYWSDQFALPIQNGWNIHAAIVDGADLVMGGDFTQAANARALHVARWNGTSWSTLGEGVSTICHALTLWNGHVIAGVEGANWQTLNAPEALVYEFDGTSWSPLGEMSSAVWAPEVVNALVVYNGELYAGGSFDAADGHATGSIARWDGTQWQAVGAGASIGQVRSMVVHGGKLVAGGYLYPSTATLAQWDGTSWSSVGDGVQNGANNGSVSDLATDGTNLYASGDMTRSGGYTFTGLPVWNGVAWSSLGTNVTPKRSLALAIHGGQLAASDGASKIGGWNGSAWNALGDGLNAEPTMLASWGTKFVAAGPGSLPGQYTNTLVTYDGVSWSPLLASWAPGMRGLAGGTAAAIHYNGQFLVAGFGGGADDHLVNLGGLGVWNGANWSAFSSGGFNGGIATLTEWRGSLVAGGYFNNVGGQSTRWIAQWNGSSWGGLNGVGSGVNNWVYATTVYQNDLIVLGAFLKDFPITTTLNGVGRWDGTAWHALGTGFPGAQNFSESPEAAIVYGSDLIVSGHFAQAGGTPASNIARWDGTAWSALGAGVDGDAYALALFEGNLVVAGEFEHAGGAPVHAAARWNGSTWSAMGDNGVDIAALRVVNGRLFAVGEFLCPDLTEVIGLAVWNGENWALLGSGFGPAPNLNSSFGFIEADGGDLYVGGSFGWANGHTAFNLARWSGLSQLGVPPTVKGASIALAAPRPNPSLGKVDLDYTMPAEGHARLAIFDIVGRRVATLVDEQVAAGPHRASWSGRDGAGRPVGSGLYVARLETALGTRSVKLVRSR